jgi:hypothetical protein
VADAKDVINDLLTILQISLHCLLAENQQQRQKLLLHDKDHSSIMHFRHDLEMEVKLMHNLIFSAQQISVNKLCKTSNPDEIRLC